MNWDDLRLLLAVSRTGTFSAAGRMLGINQSTISRRINTLQARMGAPLIARHPDGLTLTEAGIGLCQLAERTEAELDLTLSRIRHSATTLSGPLTLTCVDMMIDRLLAPELARFCAQHDQIRLTVQGRMALADLMRGQADIALRVSRSPDDRLVGPCP